MKLLLVTFKLQSHTMKSMKALQQAKKRDCLFHWIGHIALKRFNELQSNCAKNGTRQWSFFCNKTYKVFGCKVIEIRTQVSYFY